MHTCTHAYTCTLECVCASESVRACVRTCIHLVASEKHERGGGGLIGRSDSDDPLIILGVFSPHNLIIIGILNRPLLQLMNSAKNLFPLAQENTMQQVAPPALFLFCVNVDTSVTGIKPLSYYSVTQEDTARSRRRV